MFVDTSRTTSGYIMFEINYLESSPSGFEKKSANEHSLVLLVDAGVASGAIATDLATFLNNFLSGSPAGAIVTLG